MFNSTRVHGMERLLSAVRGPRIMEAPLITVANHHSCMDEPLLWGGVLTVKGGNSNSFMSTLKFDQESRLPRGHLSPGLIFQGPPDDRGDVVFQLKWYLRLL